ncbi:MAG TPA: MBL fold metallo-hydrolase [Solirubrobacteraceae bacterium]|jgi:glyoxylase-like metal-dependent hydrolase (beta-lactamase superfamily II)
MTDVRSFAVGPIQENTYIVRADAGATKALIVDPGEEPQRLLDAAQSLGVTLEGIVLTHCHFDHIGAVAPVARATGAPVWCPSLERPVLEDVMRWVPPGFGPFESWTPEHTLSGGEVFELAGMRIEVLFTPGHSPGHLTYAITSGGGADAAGQEPAQTPALLSGDVLFQGSVGRVDLPGGDWPTLEASIASLIGSFPLDSTVYPGHMGITTLGRELQSNPFLTELRAAAAQQVARSREQTA